MNPQRFVRMSLAILMAVLGLPATAPAQSEVSKPYELLIVVHVAPNRLLTDVFRDRVERELHDGFQAALGEVGRVRVTHEHPRLEDVATQGLRALDGWKDRDDIKTHFVQIDFSGVHYEIQARQYDGTVGQASPVVRRDRTRDRDFVAKAAALLLKQDFGLLGTVVSGPEGPEELVKVQLRGGGLGPMSRWVQKDEVFALAPPGGGSALNLRFALLQVKQPPSDDSRDGMCVCRFFHRYVVPSIAGYRCIKLGTVRAPLRTRWMQETPSRGLKALTGTLTVEIRRHGFDGEDSTKLRKETKQSGLLDTVKEGERGLFDHVAFARVTVGPSSSKPRVPIALVDDQPVVIGVNATQDANLLLTVRKSAWQGSVADCLVFQAGLFRKLEQLAAKAEQREEAIQMAQRGLERCRSDRVALMREKTDLLQLAKEGGRTVDTTREDRRVTEIADGEKLLEQFIAGQKKIEESENDPKTKHMRSEIERAKLLEKDLEYGQAIAIYEKIKKDGFEDKGLDDHLAELRKLWKTGNAEHDDARNFIYRVWPTLNTARLQDNLLAAHKAMKKCQEVGDIVSLRKMLKGIETHADRLAKEAGELHPDINPDDDRPARVVKEVSAELIKLGHEIQEFLQKTQPPGR